MSIRFLSAALVAAAALFAAATGADARPNVSRQIVHGKMTPTATSGTEHGRFRMMVMDAGNGAHVERIEAAARGLDVSGATAANPPSFHVFLVKSDGSGAADFGAMRVNRRGNAMFIWDTRRIADTLPSGVSSITDFGGGTIEIRDGGGTAVCSGTIPSFGGGTQGSKVFGHATAALTSTSTSFRGSGVLTARRQSFPNSVHEELTIQCKRMQSATTYTAVAIATGGTETQIGSFTTSNPLGLGGLRLTDSNIPGGGVLGLAGETVEIRDSGGSAVLTGTFPTIP